MSTTLKQLVRDQILAEGVQRTDPLQQEKYIDMTLNILTNVELLERISDALKTAATKMAVRPWI